MLETLVPWLLVAAGGSLGAMTRFAVSRATLYFLGETRFPWATFAINATGSFALGFVGALLKSGGAEWPEFWRYAMGTGFLGAYTTFSTFELETHDTLENGDWIIASAYVAGSVFCGLLAVRLGVLTGRRAFA
jgi:CrcB protein